MDAPLDPGHEQTDKLLRELFRTTGPLEAPRGMDARIMQRIAVAPAVPGVVAAPLLPKWTWLLAIGLVITVFYGAFTTSGSDSTWMPRMPSFDLAGVLTSPWVLGGVMVATILLAVEAWWVTRRRNEAYPRS